MDDHPAGTRAPVNDSLKAVASDRRGRDWPLVVRRAREDDREPVLEFASRTWDGWDYIPHAWPHWMAAQDGVVLVATGGLTASGEAPRDADGVEIAADRPIAVARVAMLSSSEAWLEGIRVDPRVRGLAVATDLQVAELLWAAVSGASVVRYATSERNEASHRLGGRHGFETVVRIRRWEWRADRADGEDGDDEEEDVSGFDEATLRQANRLRATALDRLDERGCIASGSEADRWWRRVEADPTFLAGQRLYENRGWTMQELTRGLFDLHLRRGEVITWGRPDGDESWALALMLREAAPAEDARVALSLFVGTGAATTELAAAIREAAADAVSFWLADPDPPLLGGRSATLTDAGFRPRDWSLDILGRLLGADHPLPQPDHPSALVLADEPAAVRIPEA
jgi:GNAT superfamily N-acetyltransferase